MYIHKKKYLVVTTPLQSTWEDNIQTILIGEWCKKLDMQSLWSKDKFTTLEYHWSDRGKFHKDHEYLENLYEVTLKALVKFLNNEHQLNLATHSWRIILGPWLYHYISVVWERWEAVSQLKGFQEKYPNHLFETKVLNSNQDNFTPNSFNQFREFLDADWWNHMLFEKIFAYRSDVNIRIKKISENLEMSQEFNNDPSARASLSFLRKLFSYAANGIDFLIEKISSNKQDYMIFHSYFPRSFMLKLCFYLKIKPRWYSQFKTPLDDIPNIERSFSCNLDISPNNNFESFLQKILPTSIPRHYLEGFNGLVLSQKSLPDAKVIFTANAYIYNELFKVWSAFQVQNNSKLIISSHGGSFDPLLNNFNHEEKIADYRVVWGKPWYKNQVRLPPNKLNFKIKNYQSNGQITFVDYEASRYGDRCVSCPRGPLTLEVINSNIAFLQILENAGLIKFIKIRSKGLGLWESKKRFEESFGNNIFCIEKLQNQSMNKSRLVICTYPQTTFAEAMYSGIPTMLYFDKSLWEIQPIYEELLETLEKAKIVFTDQDLAAKHVVKIHNNPMIWWNEDQTIRAREAFNEICLTIDENPALSWKVFFESILKDHFDD